PTSAEEDPEPAAPSEEPALPEELDPGAQGPAEGQDRASGTGGFDPAWLALLPLLAIPFLPALWRAGGRRFRLGAKRLSAPSAWDEMLDLAVDYGIELRDALTPRQAASALARTVPEAHRA